MTRLRLVIAENHHATRDVLRRLLEPHHDIAAIVPDGLALRRAVEAYEPDAIVADVSMPLLNGISAAQIIKQRYPCIKIIIISVHSEHAYVAAAFDAGANRYILKASMERELVKNIEELFAAA